MPSILRFVSTERGPARRVVERRPPRVGDSEILLFDAKELSRYDTRSMELVGRSSTAEPSSWPVFKVVACLLAFLSICILGIAILRVRKCIRRAETRKRHLAVAEKTSGLPRSPSFYSSSIFNGSNPELPSARFNSEKGEVFSRRSNIDPGYKYLQRPRPAVNNDNARTVTSSEYFWQESLERVPQSQAEHAFPSPAELSVAPKSPRPVVQRNGRSRMMLIAPPLPKHTAEDADTIVSGVIPAEREHLGGIPKDGDHRRLQPSKLDALIAEDPEGDSDDVSSFFDFHKVRRRPPPLTPGFTNWKEYSPSSSSGSQYSSTNTPAMSEGDIPAITITEVTQTLLAPPKLPQSIDRTHVLGELAFPTSPSPSDLGLASPFSLNSNKLSESERCSSFRRRNSMTKLQTGISIASSPPRLVTVVRRFFSTQNNEMDIREGETLRLVKEFQDDWCAVERIDTGEMGVVPRYCITDNTDARQQGTIAVMTSPLPLMSRTQASPSASNGSRF